MKLYKKDINRDYSNCFGHCTHSWKFANYILIDNKYEINIDL